MLLKLMTRQSGRSRGARSIRRCVALEPLEVRVVPAFTTIVNNGPSANRIDMVFVGDGYTTGDLQAGTYGNHIKTLLDYLFVPGQNVGGNQDPFTRYAKYFNVHRIDVVSAESGVTIPQNNITRNTALKSTYRFDGQTDRLLYVDDTITNNLVTQELTGAGFQPEMRFAVTNSTVYGGGGGQWAVYAGGVPVTTPPTAPSRSRSTRSPTPSPTSPTNTVATPPLHRPRTDRGQRHQRLHGSQMVPLDRLRPTGPVERRRVQRRSVLQQRHLSARPTSRK